MGTMFTGFIPLDDTDLQAVGLTRTLAATSTTILLILGIPLAWWLAHSRAKSTHLIAAIVTLPVFLPPTVLGFYLLMLMGPQGVIGVLMQRLGLASLPFTFEGLVVTSVIYSMPFVVQPICDRFKVIGKSTMETAATLRVGPLEAFFALVLPMAKHSILAAAILGFAHTVGEFGVVLMIGGNIPGVTRVLSVQIYDHVEAMEYDQAHVLAGSMLVFALVSLTLLHRLGRTKTDR